MKTNFAATFSFRAALALAAALSLQAASDSPAGVWKTVDDKTGKPRGLVRIYEENGEYFGRIAASFDPKEQNERCDKCPGDRRNQPVIGLLILRHMKRDGDEYNGGDILDPDTGKVYRCKMHLTDNGQRLELRGFIGMSLFGRTQTWFREK